MKLSNLRERQLKPALRFEGGEIVRLKKDYPDDDLEVGDCGLVWGVYDTNPPFYEASFFDANGNTPDIMFAHDEIDDAVDVIDVQEISSAVAREHFVRWMNEDSN